MRRTLHEHQLLKTPRPKPQRNPPQPRFFERATPNQLWQTDIFTFRLGGKNAYLIGFLDDHSRYAYSEVLPDEKAPATADFMERAIGHFAARGIRIDAVMTDNAWAYIRSSRRAKILAEMKQDDEAIQVMKRALTGMQALDTLHSIEFRQDLRVDPSLARLREAQ